MRNPFPMHVESSRTIHGRALPTLASVALFVALSGSTLVARGEAQVARGTAQQTRQAAPVSQATTASWPGGRGAPPNFTVLLRTLPANATMRVEVGPRPPRGGSPSSILVIRNGEGTIIVCLGNSEACATLILAEQLSKAPR